MKTIKQCKCGCNSFWGHSVYHLDVKVDEYKRWLADGEVYDSIEIFGPFSCNECGTKYENWEDIPDVPDDSPQAAQEPEKIRYDAVFLEKELEQGVNAGDIAWMASLLEGAYYLPIEVQAENSAAIGFITVHAANDLNYDYEAFSAGVFEILNDMEKENETHNYRICGQLVKITRSHED